MNKKITVFVVGLLFLAMSLFAGPANAADCVPTSPTDTIVHHDAVTHVVHHDAVTHDETVIDAEAVAAQHYSLKGNSGIGKDDVPVFPADYWQANAPQEPNGHYNSAQKPDGSLYVEGDSGLHYTSAGSSGLRDWFYFQAAVPEKSHVETVVDTPAYDETVVDVPAYDEVVHTDGTTCHKTPNPPETTTKHYSTPVVKHPVAPAPVPSEVEAGLYSVDSATAPADDHTGLFVLGGVGILLLGAAALRRSKN